MPIPSLRPFVRLSLAPVAGLAVAVGGLAGCAMPLTPFAGQSEPEIATSEGDAVPAAARPPARAIAPRSPSVVASDPAGIATEAQIVLPLQVSYLERLFVPRGSEFEITVTDAAGAETVTTALSEAGPPYALSVPVAADAAYPLTVDVVLRSRVGHVLSGQGAVAAAPAGPVEIRIAVTS